LNAGDSPGVAAADPWAAITSARAAADAPAGAPLALEQMHEVDAALSALARGQAEHTLSDPSFANLYLFRRPHDYRYLPRRFACITGRTYDGARHLLPLFELQRTPLATLRELLAGHECFYPISATQVNALDPTLFEWTASRDDADYLYPASHFLHYRGTALNKKRNLVKQLLAAHSVSAAPYAPEHLECALRVLRGWMQDKVKTSGEADEPACTEALQLAPRLGLHGFIYHAGGAPAGFVLAQPIQPGVWVMRFAKGLNRYKGIYQHMFQHFCAAMPQVRWLNFEQDMGHAGFRRTKLSYQPSALLPKFRVWLRGPR
jgi:uncharacterized protein